MSHIAAIDDASLIDASSPSRPARPRSRSLWPPIPIALVLLSFLLPTELSLDVAGLRLSPYRILFLLLLPFALQRLLTRRDTKVRNFDVVIMGFAAWQVGIFTYNAGAEGLTFGGSLALEILGGYLIARAWVRDVAALQATLRFLLICLAVAAAGALLDTLSGSYFTNQLIKVLTGGGSAPPPDVRMGLIRAAFTFDHPIHYGVFCASFLALIWYAESQRLRRYAKCALVVFGTALAISSAPLLSIVLQIAMLTWEYWSRGFALRTHLTLATLSGLYIGLSFVASRTPIQIFISGLTLDPWTGIYRLWIWEHGLINVWASPWTGLGLNDWERPEWMVASTIDAYWLVLAMRSGIPAFLLLALAIYLITRAVVRRGTRSKDRVRRRLASGWIISLISICLLGATVHYWNVLHAMLFFYLGLAGALADPKPQRRNRSTRNHHQRLQREANGPATPAWMGIPAGQPV